MTTTRIGYYDALNMPRPDRLALAIARNETIPGADNFASTLTALITTGGGEATLGTWRIEVTDRSNHGIPPLIYIAHTTETRRVPLLGRHGERTIPWCLYLGDYDTDRSDPAQAVYDQALTHLASGTRAGT